MKVITLHGVSACVSIQRTRSNQSKTYSEDVADDYDEQLSAFQLVFTGGNLAKQLSARQRISNMYFTRN